VFAPPKPRGTPGRDAINARYREMQDEERENDLPGDLDDIDPEAVSEADLTPAGDSQNSGGEDPELTLLVFGNRIRAKRSELIEKYDLAGLSDGCIISIAPPEQLANQQLAEAKEGTENHRTPNARHAGSASAGRRSSLTNQLGGSVSLTQTDCRARSPRRARPGLEESSRWRHRWDAQTTQSTRPPSAEVL
jgi:hypothetical protein